MDLVRMNTDLFTPELIQAVSDWQRDGDHRQKVKRGQRLKECAAMLPIQFRTCDRACYRQEAHKKDRIWRLLADRHLPETISSWTTDLAVAKDLKGGVPPAEWQGVIFKLTPPSGTIVLNLVKLFADADFLAALEAHQPRTRYFHNGIGRWRDSQSEVVLELDNLDPATVYSYGGLYSKESIAALVLQRKPTAEDLAALGTSLAKIGSLRDDWWLSPSGTQAVLKRIETHLPRLRAKKAREQTVAASRK
jgi:hypothetical protein